MESIPDMAICVFYLKNLEYFTSGFPSMIFMIFIFDLRVHIVWNKKISAQTIWSLETSCHYNVR